MNRITEKLSNYEDFELAFLMKYKITTYMQSTQSKVIEYVKSRGLDSYKIKQLIKEYEKKVFLDNHERCPRCKTDKFMSEFVDFRGTRRSYDEIPIIDVLTGKPTQKEQITCQVCGYLIVNPNNEKWTRQTDKSFLDKIISKLKTIRK